MGREMIKCKGGACPIKKECHRYTSTDCEGCLEKEPFTIKDEVFNCDLFWGANAQGMFEQLNDIVRGNEK